MSLPRATVPYPIVFIYLSVVRPYLAPESLTDYVEVDTVYFRCYQLLVNAP